MNIELEAPKIGISGAFHIQKFKGYQLTYDSGEFGNLITDNGVDYLGNSFAYIKRMDLGSGNSAPAFSDVQLDALIVSKAASDSSSNVLLTEDDGAGGTNYIQRWSTSATFAEGEAAGNISEIGMGPSNSADPLFSRALIKDTNGDPTTITVLSDEILIVTYYLYFHKPSQDLFTGVVDGYTITARAYRNHVIVEDYLNWPLSAYYKHQRFVLDFATARPQAIIAHDANPTSTSGASSATSFSNAAYVSGTYERTFTAFWAIDRGNMNIQTINIDAFILSYQFGFDPAIPKTADDELTFTFKLSWGRHV